MSIDSLIMVDYVRLQTTLFIKTLTDVKTWHFWNNETNESRWSRTGPDGQEIILKWHEPVNVTFFLSSEGTTL